MGRLPLYENLSVNDFCRAANKNHGLYFNKYMGYWNNDWSLEIKDKKQPSPKQNWIDYFINSSPLGNQGELNEYQARRERLLKAHSSESQFFATNAALVAGMGNSNPIENGMSWHHTLGVPYIPGSSLKGLVRDWLESWIQDDGLVSVNEGVSEESKQGYKHALNRIFGSDAKETKNKSRPDQVGSVIFHDVIPAKPVQLKAEIMTPHYSEYYQSKGDNIVAPGDWLSPTPIPFLVVDEGQTFQFAVMPRTQSESDMEAYSLVVDWLKDSLESLGIGAKTATGYGQFLKENDEDEHIAALKMETNQLNHDHDQVLMQLNLNENELHIQQLADIGDNNELGKTLKTLLNEIKQAPESWTVEEKHKLQEQIEKLGQSTGFGLLAAQIRRLTEELLT